MIQKILLFHKVCQNIVCTVLLYNKSLLKYHLPRKEKLSPKISTALFLAKQSHKGQNSVKYGGLIAYFNSPHP